MTSIKELNREIEANAVELDFAHRYENGYDYWHPVARVHK